MSTIAERASKLTRFCLALLLWLHGLFLLKVDWAFVPRLEHALHLTSAELLMFTLLVLFSFLAGTGLWRMVGNLAYLYFFPFVLIGYAGYGGILGLIAIGRLFKRKSSLTTSIAPPKTPEQIEIVVAQPTPDLKTPNPPVWKRIGLVLLRPLRRFTMLWCLLLIVATHAQLLWLSLVVVFCHLARTVYGAVAFTLFSGTWFARLEAGIRSVVDDTLAKLALVTQESEPTNELRNLLNQVRAFEAVRTLENQSVVMLWAWFLCLLFLSFVYAYLAFLFAFAYYGVARVSGFQLPWLDSFVISLFIPFLIGNLPKSTALMMLGGIHCVLIVSVGVGTVVRYLGRRFESIRSVATIVSVRLAEDGVKEKYSILERKFPDTTGVVKPETPK